MALLMLVSCLTFFLILKIFFLIYIFISNQNLQLYKLICWRKSRDAL
jgi:hypothetical protein